MLRRVLAVSGIILMVSAILQMLALAAGCACTDVAPRSQGPVRLMLPAEAAIVPIVSDGQRAFFELSDRARCMAQGDQRVRAEWLALGWHPRPVTFVWDGIKTRKEQVRFRIWREEDDVCVCDTNFLYLTTGRFEWDNFRVGTAYRWGLEVKGKGAATSRFVTEDMPPRLIRVPGVPNLRDLGGWRTQDGRRVRQGLRYRSANLCENAAECMERPPRPRLDAAGCLFMTNALGIRTELDLRAPKECEGLVGSPLGPSVRRVEISSGCYAEMTNETYKAACLGALRLIADGRNLPLLFHCSGGRDRTGTLAFIVNGLLGVSPDDLARDWDATALWDNESKWFNRNGSYAALLAVMGECPGSTLNERIESYVKSIGFENDEIVRLRELLIEPKAGAIEHGRHDGARHGTKGPLP